MTFGRRPSVLKPVFLSPEVFLSSTVFFSSKGEVAGWSNNRGPIGDGVLRIQSRRSRFVWCRKTYDPNASQDALGATSFLTGEEGSFRLVLARSCVCGGTERRRTELSELLVASPTPEGWGSSLMDEWYVGSNEDVE